MAELGTRLSLEFGCPVLAVLNHDDDILWYQLFENGKLADEYDSTPGYFDATAEPSIRREASAEIVQYVWRKQRRGSR